jgi:hypothetical protein
MRRLIASDLRERAAQPLDPRPRPGRRIETGYQVIES